MPIWGLNSPSLNWKQQGMGNCSFVSSLVDTDHQRINIVPYGNQGRPGSSSNEHRPPFDLVSTPNSPHRPGVPPMVPQDGPFDPRQRPQGEASEGSLEA